MQVRVHHSPSRSFSIALPLILFILQLSNAVLVTGISTDAFDVSGAILVQDQFCISHAPVDTWDEHADNLKSMNPSYLRFNIEWFQCAKDYGKNTTVYDFSYYDGVFSHLEARAIKPLGCFVYGWGWWPNSKPLPREDWFFYLNFVDAFVSRYASNLKYYESWNEPNPAGHSFWTGTDDEFYEFMSLLVPRVRASNPAALILSPGIVGPDVEYLDGLITHFGVSNFSTMFDLISYHAYSGRNAEMIESKIDDVKRVLAKHGLDSKPVWITEVGMSTNINDPGQAGEYYASLLRYQASMVVKVYAQTIAGNVSSTFWYCLYDWCGDLVEGEANFGLMTCNNDSGWQYAPKPAGHAYKHLATLLPGSMYYPNGISINAPPGGKTRAYYFRTTRNTTAIIAWTENIASKARVTITCEPPPDDPLATMFNVTLHDIYTNATSRVINITNNAFDLDIGYEPVLLDIGSSTIPGPFSISLDIVHDWPVIAITVLAIALAIAGITLLIVKERASRTPGGVMQAT